MIDGKFQPDERYRMKSNINYIKYSCEEYKTDGNSHTYTFRKWTVDKKFTNILNEITYQDTTVYS